MTSDRRRWSRSVRLGPERLQWQVAAPALPVDHGPRGVRHDRGRRGSGSPERGSARRWSSSRTSPASRASSACGADLGVRRTAVGRHEPPGRPGGAARRSEPPSPGRWPSSHPRDLVCVEPTAVVLAALRRLGARDCRHRRWSSASGAQGLLMTLALVSAGSRCTSRTSTGPRRHRPSASVRSQWSRPPRAIRSSSWSTPSARRHRSSLRSITSMWAGRCCSWASTTGHSS